LVREFNPLTITCYSAVSDFYSRIGAIGGRKGTTGGFYQNRELAREAGKKGGRISKRRKSNG
jgi:general stress protein YciG